MSTVKVQGNASGTGSITLASPNTNSNRTLNLPDADGTIIYSDSSGNVGIGTSSPSGKLDVAGNSYLNGLRLNGANTSDTIYQATGDLGISVASAANLKFYTNASERARIDSSGNLLVNRTSNIGSGQYSSLFAGNALQGITLQDSTTTSGSGFIGFYNSGGTSIGNIARNGTTNAVLYNTSSDYRLKEDVTPLTGAIEIVSALKPVKWVWKDCNGQTGEGFIAHEVQEVVPGAVNGEKDAVDRDGNPIYQGMDSSYLVATLTAAIQEQQTMIKSLTDRIAVLETK